MLLALEEYYVQWRAAPSVFLPPAPSVLARPEFVGGAPSVMVLRWWEAMVCVCVTETPVR